MPSARHALIVLMLLLTVLVAAAMARGGAGLVGWQVPGTTAVQAAALPTVHPAPGLLAPCPAQATEQGMQEDRLSAAAAQVVFDSQVTNEDRSEMMAFDGQAIAVQPAAHALAVYPPQAITPSWPQGLLRPPRHA